MKTLKNVIVTAIAGLLLLLAFITGAGGSIQLSPLSVTYEANGMRVLDGITTFTVAFLGIVTITDLFQAFGWDLFVPTYIIEAKAKKMKEAVENILERDRAFVNSNQQARVDYILQKLRITHSQMLDGLIRLRAMPLTDTKDAIDRMGYILQKMPGIVVKQDKSPVNRTYKEVQFYIDFISSMRDNEYGRELSKTFSHYISLDMQEQKISGVTKVVIPADSNFLLGFKVAESLGYPPVIMRTEKGRIFEDQPWDGELSSSDKVIIVHDVLVSGDQVVATMQKLKDAQVEVVALYCIVNRLEYPGEEKVQAKDRSCKVRAMLELNDEIISKQYYKGN